MKILYIATQVDIINSSAAIRNSALINGLTELGHDVHVETIDYPTQYVSVFLRENLHAASVGRTPLLVYNFNHKVKTGGIAAKSSLLISLLKKIRSFAYFPDISVSWKKYFKYTSVRQDYDLIISSSDSKVSHMVAERVYRRMNVRWIQVWGDPWYDDYTISRLNAFRAYRHEKKLLSKADKVIYVSEATLSKQKTLFEDYAEKMYFVPRGFFIAQEGENRIRDGKIVISYTGNLFWGRSVSALINSLKEYNDSHECKFVLNIYGVQDTRFIEAVKEFDFVHTYAPVDYQHVLKTYDESNILLFISNSSHSTQIPGKFFDYSGTTRLILCLMADDEGEIAEYLKSFDRCLVVRNDEKSIAACMDELKERASFAYKIVPDFYPRKVAEQILK